MRIYFGRFALLVIACSLSGALSAQTNYPFSSTNELDDFSLHNVSTDDLQNGQLLLEDNQAGDTQITAEDDSGILGNNSYSGGLEVILQYTDHALPESDYSALPGLFLANDEYTWEAPGTYPRVNGKIHSSIDASWFDFSNNAEQAASASITPRQSSAYLRLLRQQDAVSAWYWHNDAWQQIGSDIIPYTGNVRVGVRMFSYYKDLYSVKLEHLTINVDQDSDGIIDAIETLMGTNPQLADTDNDGNTDGSDLWPLDNTLTDKTRIKNRGVIDTQLFRVGDTWSILVNNLSPENVSPTVILSDLMADAYVTVAGSARSFSTVEDGFTDTQILPAFASRLYQFPATAYTAPDLSQSIYPSTLTSWVIPGFQQTPTDPDTLTVLPSIEAVKDWEVSHADISFGGGFDERNEEMKAAVGYMYNQILSFNPDEREMYLRDRAEQNGLDYEDFMLHLSEDTVLEVRNAEHSTKTPFYGVPAIMGYTRSATDSGVSIPSNSELDTGVWDESANDGALYVYLFEAFDQLQLALSSAASDGELLVEYPSAVDSNGVVSQWQTMSITDGTNNLSQDGTVSWTPPANWKRAATYDPESKTGHYFANKMLADGSAYYMVRLKWTNGSAAAPRLNGVSLKRWLKPVSEGSSQFLIPGWDVTNDGNNDGYIDDAEFANRSNTTASARFRYEARAVPLGSMWSSHSSFCRPNLSNGILRQYLADYYKKTWGENGEAGAYNDDFFRQLGEDSFQIITGGQLSEYAGKSLQDLTVQSAYVQDFKRTLETIKSTTGSEWISANISGENLFTESERLPFIDSLDAVLREDYLTPSLGLSGFFGVNKTWDNFALAAKNIKSVITMHHRYGRVLKQGNTDNNWAKDSESGLALYYLMNVADTTYFHAWNSTFQYGSNNTFEATTNFWKAGVPKNYAYQPVDMLKVDIGQPSGEIPAGKEAMKYMVRTAVPLSDYTVIGDTTDTVLSHAEIGESGEVSVLPSNIYYLQRSANNVVADGPAEMVLARSYTNGLILYRTSFIGGDADFMATTSESIELPGSYQRVKTDGTLGESITSISLQGYEGAILVKVEVVVEAVDEAPDESENNQAVAVIPSTNLEEDASQWGGYEEGQPSWVIETSTEHSPTGSALNCGLTGGEPYSNIHCYRNLPADPDAKYFSMALDFFMPDTTFNNVGAPSLVQALEFTMNQWQDELRYEWALQWMNVGSNGPQWRYWDANQPDDERWVPLSIQQELAINTWHNLKLEGEVRNGQVYYRYFVINDQRHELNITLDADSTPGNPNLLAVAVQADGNGSQDAYDLLIDNVSFDHTPDRRLDVAPMGSHFRMIGNKIFDPQGNLFVPRGVNIFPWHGEADTVERIGGCWNFNTVRLHSWILPDADTDQWKDHIVYLDEPLIFDPSNIGNLRTYDIRNLIESYTSRGIVVLFDVHDLLGKYFEGQHLEDYKTFIADFASKFKDNPYVWIDLHNEPGTYQGAGNADQGIPAHDFSRWQAEYTAMREAVRTVAPDMPIFASGDAWGQDTGPNWNGDELVVTEESALLSNGDFFKSDTQLAATIHVYDQWNYGGDRTGRLADYFDRVQSATQSPLLIGEFGYEDNTGSATEALYTLLKQAKYQHMGRIAWTWAANDNNDLTTDAVSHGSGAAIDSCNTQPTNLTRLGELVWQDTHTAELDSDNDGLPNQQDDDDDNDGIPDLWEVEHGMDSTDAADAATDRNNDGQSNLQEYFQISPEEEPNNSNDQSSSSNDSGGGGSFGLHLLMMLFMVWAFRRLRLSVESPC